MNKRILFLLILAIMLIPSAHAQTVAGWSISTDKPFYFIGDTMNVTVRGIPNVNYSMDLVNVSNYNNTIHLISRLMPENGTDSVRIELSDEYVRGGVFYLNISVDGVHMVHKRLKLEYSEDYLHDKEHEWLRDSIAWIERAISNIAYDIIDMWDVVKSNSRALFVLFVVILVIGGQVLLHVIIPRFHAWGQLKIRMASDKRQKYGIVANHKQWHDTELNPIPAKNIPNIASIVINMERIGYTPEETKCIIWDASGDIGRGDFIKEMLTRYKWRKIKEKTLKRFRSDSDAVAQAYIDMMESDLETFRKKVKKYQKAYLEGKKKNE